MNSLKSNAANEQRFYKRGDYGAMPEAPKLGGVKNANEKQQENQIDKSSSTSSLDETASHTNSTDSVIAARSHFNGVSIQPVKNPQRSTVRFVDNILRCRVASLKETGWLPSIMQVLGNPLKPLAVKQKNVPPASISDQEVDSLMQDPEIASLITASAFSCADTAMKAIQENAPSSFWNLPDCDQQLERIHNQFVGFEARVPDPLRERSFVNEKISGIPEINCRGVARRAITNALEFAQKIATASPERKELFHFDVGHVAKEAAKAAVKIYLQHYVENFPSVAREYPELTFEPVSGVAFAPPTLETNAIFVEGDVDVVARQKAEEAGIKTIAGFWEAAVAAAE